MLKPLPFVPYDDRYVLVPIKEAEEAGALDPRIATRRGIGGDGGLTTKPDVNLERIIGGFNDLSEQLKRYVEREEGAGSRRGRGIDRDADFPIAVDNAGDSPSGASAQITSADLARMSFDEGLKEAIRLLKDEKSTKEQHLAAYYYQLGAMTGRGLAIQIDPVDALTSPDKVSRSCDSRGACRDLGEKLDKLFDQMSRGRGRGTFRDLGDWADKVRDCLKG